MMYYPDVPALEPDELELLCHEYLEHNATLDPHLADQMGVKRGLRNLDGTGVLRIGLLCAILHESAHALVYRKLWHCWPDLALSPFGICLQLRGVPMTPEEELRLASAGPLANLLACCTVLLYMQTAGQYSYSGYWFACTNLLVGGANLLPLPGLDGAHILHGMFYSLDKRHRI